MRGFALGLVAMASLTAQPVLAQTTACTNENDQKTFEVVALKSELMVLAIDCDTRDNYNAFINRYRPDLLSAEKDFDAFFKRRYGARAQAEHDRYITQLANSQAGIGLVQGTDFCERNAVMFHEVMALQGGSDLPQYAAAKDLLPAAAAPCVGGAEPAPARPKKK